MNDHFARLLLHHLPPSHPNRAPILPPPPRQTMYAHTHTIPSHTHPISSIGWHSPPPCYNDQSALFASPLAPSSWANGGPSCPHDFLLPFHHHPHKEYNPGPSYSVPRSETSSAVSRESDLSPSPEVAEVVCNAPLVAPKPLPYHSPTFLLYDLPDEDEDLSHPPYTHRPHKRKRALEEEDADEHAEHAATHPLPAKRRSIRLPRWPRWESQAGSSSAAHAQATYQWGTAATANAASAAAAPSTPAALRHPAAAFSRRHRAR